MIAACGLPGGPGSGEEDLEGFDLVIAADGGVDVARRLGRSVDLVVGDLDSASPEALDWARSGGAHIERHPATKDSTDLELALAWACAEADSVHVIASMGGRVDHAAAGLAVLASDRWARSAVSASIDGARIDVVRGRRTLGGRAGDLISLMAVGGSAQVTTAGLQYPLNGDLLDPAEARGVSNMIADPPPVVEVVSGVVLAIRPLGPS